MAKDRQSRLVQSEAGQAIVEFALTITITLLLIFGLIEFSRAIYTASVIQWAAQQGARAGIVESSEADIAVAVHGRMAGLDTSLALITVSYPSAAIVQVDVAYRYDLIVPIISQITGDSIQMRASASMIKY
ncbi:MAG: pilus assembly protein [Caldilineaceae bacterium]|nr:pilus assembly protein [Caldilineaceae bacterium]